MKRDLPAYVYRRKGGLLYFERRGQKSQRIVNTPGTPAFALEYARAMNGTEEAPSKRNFRALVKSYVASERYTTKAARTVQDYDRVLDWVIKKLGDHDPAKIQRQHVIRARDANKETVRFANYVVQVLRILFEHAIDLGWLGPHPVNPARGVSLIKAETREREPWPDHLITAYRTTATGPASLIFELCLGTGQRIGDVLKMRWDDIEADGIHVRQGKTKQRLWVPITPHLKAALAATPRIGLTICAWGDRGRPRGYRSAADLVLGVRKQIGAEQYDIHSLRYTTAAELAALGCSDELIMSITGHKTSAMVAKYAGPARQRARATEAQGRRE